ncbi:hypothetical protein PtA15_15A402 [Puccinia triticina]|uniref:J domain-containing protein n=1 Tax=Puccinia triticina TaxID=208348 RepID=A0ABY7D5Z3_9BASI|nr:uncharacterized protein PtA15_15A402 [Puccinia triticina]WAQ92008.1 hypothetical protein PtA15_15A402 [Puccinia triticina]
MEAEQPEQSFSEQEPIDLDSPARVSPEPEAEQYKRRRIHSPDPIAQAALIDSNLARVLWDTRDKLEAQFQKRRRRSDQSLTEANTSSATQKPSKRARQTSPQPEAGTKRSRDAGDSPSSHLPRPDHKRVKQEEIPSASTRSQPTASSSRLKATPAKAKTGVAPSNPSSSSNPPPNFISEVKSDYAIQVAKADKLRREGNTYYLSKNYEQALIVYTQAIGSYPPASFPGLARAAGYAFALANRASAYMALGQYQQALEDLQGSITETDPPSLLNPDNRLNFFKRVCRRARCYLALLDGPNASRALNIIGGPQSNTPILPDDQPYEEFEKLSRRANFLVEHVEQINDARKNELWRGGLQVMKSLEKEIVTWGFKFNPSHLPGSWTIWKAEILAHLGKPVEAQRVLLHVRATDPFRCECAIVHALIALSNGDLGLAQKRLFGILQLVPDYAPASDLLEFFTPLLSSIGAIESTAARGSHLQAVALCEKFVADYHEGIFTTLRIKVETIKLEQIAQQSMKDPRFGPQLYLRLDSLIGSLLSKMNYGSPTLLFNKEVYEPYRVYLTRAVFAQARATYQYKQLASLPIYTTVAELLRLWPTMDLPARDSMLEEIRSRTNFHNSSHSYTNGFHSHSSHSYTNGFHSYSSHSYTNGFHSHSSHSRSSRPSGHSTKSDSDPKGYYKVLGLTKSASAKEIKTAFRTLSLTHHPDKGGQTALFQTINEAHSVLSNPDSKSLYDLTGR